MGTDMLFTLSINICITAFAYLIVPTLYVLRGEYVSKEKRRKIVILNGIIVFTFFSIIHINSGSDHIANVSPAILWSSIGSFLLARKYSTPPDKDIEVATNNTVAVSFNEIKQPVQAEQHNTPIFSEPTVLSKQKDKKSIGWLTFTLMVIAITLLVGNMAQHNKILKQKETIDELKETMTLIEDDLISNINYYEDQLDLLVEKANEDAEKIDFYDSSIVFVIEGYGNYYYTYDEMMQVTQGTSFTYWAYNLEQAISRGYKAWN